MASITSRDDSIHTNSVPDEDVFHGGVPRRDAMTGIAFGAVGLASAASLVFAGQALGQDSSPVKSSSAPLSAEDLGWDPKTKQYILPPLPYKYEDLEPHIDKQTMELHHDKHHDGYVKGLNRAIQALAELRKNPPEATETRNWLRELAFHGSGHFLHVLFWNCMKPAAQGGGGQPKGSTITQAINDSFGSFKAFSDQFQAAANAVEGGGWGILAWEPVSRRLMILQAEKHQNLTAWGVTPIVVIDVWEHAYYLKYQNKRKDYIAAVMNVIDWDGAEKRLSELTAKRAG